MVETKNEHWTEIQKWVEKEDLSAENSNQVGKIDFRIILDFWSPMFNQTQFLKNWS